MTELKRFEQWWDAGDDIPNDGPYTPDTPIQFAWAGWQAALEQTEQPAQQEPVAWLDEYGNTFPLAAKQYSIVGKHWKPLYITPPQRTWVGLTDAELDVIYEQHHNQYGECESPNFGYERAIETKIKEKNT